jgi:hypothetical protein
LAAPNAPSAIFLLGRRTVYRAAAFFNLPIRINEFDITSDDEELRVDYTRDFLTFVAARGSAWPAGCRTTFTARLRLCPVPRLPHENHRSLPDHCDVFPLGGFGGRISTSPRCPAHREGDTAAGAFGRG